MNWKFLIEQMLNATAVRINGTNSFDIQVRDERFYKRVLKDGSLGLGESYMDGWWECEALDDLLFRLLKANLDEKISGNLKLLYLSVMAKIFNRQSSIRAYDVAKKHYNLGNDLFVRMLDKRMIYSCAYWDLATNLDEAQEHKLNLICRKLKLASGLKVLDIGCGWGGFAQYAAENYGVHVTGITISGEQAELARKRCAGLDVDIQLTDYRSISGEFDRIVSIGMFEHVGPGNYASYMDTVHRNLKHAGIFLLHTIGGNERQNRTDPWIDRYIFPNGVIPNPGQICTAFEKYFTLQDWHNFGHNYDRTLMEWLRRFKLAWPDLKSKYDNRFYRMWEYYLNISAASFRCQNNYVWQIVLTKKDDILYYRSIR